MKIKGWNEPIQFTDYLYRERRREQRDGRGARPPRDRAADAEPVRSRHDRARRPQGQPVKFEANYGDLKEIAGADRRARARPAQHDPRADVDYDGKDITEDIPIDVPASLAGSIVQLEVGAGDTAKLDGAPPVDLPTLVAAFRKLLPGNVWAATIYAADEGIDDRRQARARSTRDRARQAAPAEPYATRAGLQADRAHDLAGASRDQRVSRRCSCA